MSETVMARVGERTDFPAVCAKTCRTQLSRMAEVGTSCLRSEWPKPWIVVNTETKERRCAMCEEWKSIYEFHKQPESTFGRGGYCVSCETEYQREYRQRAA